MNLSAYVAQQCARHDVRRGQLPTALGLGNINKALRRLDALCAGEFFDADLLERMRRSPLFVPADLDAAVAVTIDEARAANAACEERAELLRRNRFSPHLWVEHRPGRPDCTLLTLYWAGMNHFKRVAIPQEVLDMVPIEQRLQALTLLIEQLPNDAPTWSRLHYGFGPPLLFHYRITYDAYYTFDLAQQRWSEERSGQPPIPTISAGHR
ncbi:MAG: hypothetical protein IPF59_08030 [Ignavibacteria bacterium]|nr:hypothetical protein [Ignavibacteria bacterium]